MTGVLTLLQAVDENQELYEGSYRRALDRIESKLTNAPRIKSMAHFLANISPIEITSISANVKFPSRIRHFLRNCQLHSKMYSRGNEIWT